MCCDKVATTHYFFKKYCVVASLSQLTTQYFLKKYCVVAEKNKVADTCHHIIAYKISSTVLNRLI